MTRISRGRIALRREPIDFGGLVRAICEDLRDTFEKNGLSLEVRTTPDPVPVFGDPVRLAQMVGNLLHNAVKFSSPGGRTTVTLRTTSDGSAELRVVDRGIGIAPEFLEQVFEPFVQASGAIDRARGGLGLGLALVRSIAELHDGRVEVHSDGPGKGAEFVVRIPVDIANSVVAPTKPRSGPERSRRVLVIEDNVDAADSLSDLLRMHGHTVEVAHSGADGIEAARRFRPDVVLCDIGLPGLNGYEVARRLRADEAFRNVRLIALSGYAQEDDITQARDAGFLLHVAKPLDPDSVDVLLADGA